MRSRCLQLLQNLLVFCLDFVVLVLSLVESYSVLTLCNFVIESRIVEVFLIYNLSLPRWSSKYHDATLMSLVSLSCHNVRYFIEKFKIVLFYMFFFFLLVEDGSCINPFYNVFAFDVLVKWIDFFHFLAMDLVVFDYLLPNQ